MKALVKFAPGRAGMELREVPEPTPKAGEIKIAVKAAGICGTDIHIMLDERKANMPVTIGHEFVGQVCELGEGVTDFSVGDWVVALPAVGGCGECEFCRSGQVTLCPHRASIGTHLNGAMAEYVVVPARFAFHVPDEVEDKISLAVAEPCGCAVLGIMEKIDVKPGDVAVVSGPGTLGLFCVQLLKVRGAYVVASGLPQDAKRLALARELGADATAESLEELQAIVQAKNPRGADIAVEAAGVGPSANTCLEVLRKQGTYLQVGVFGKPVTANLDHLMEKELNMVGTNSTAVSSWHILLDLIRQGKLQLTPLISLKFPLEQWQEGFDAMLGKAAFKILLIP